MIVAPHKQTLLLKVRNPNSIFQVIPNSRPIDYQGHNVAVKLGLDEMQVLRNMGVRVPSPIEHYYSWPGKYVPFAHQIRTAAFATLNRRCFVLNEMGTAKTASVLWAADYLMKLGYIRKVIIAAPLSTLVRVWQNEIFDVLMHRTCAVLHGTREKRFSKLNLDVDFYIVNHEGLEIIGPELVKRVDIDLVIVDEASVYRNASTKRYKILKKTIQPTQRLWLLTGAPCPNAPTDAWALAKLVRPDQVPEYFGSFKRMTMQQITQFKWVPKPDAYNIAYRALQPGIRFKKEDCLDLPPVLISDREVETTPEQRKVYKEMKTHMMADILAAGGVNEISAVNAADQITKLRQILCGVVKVPNTDNYVEIDHAPRVGALIDCIAEADAKVIVVVPFKGIVLSLAAAVRKHYSCEVLNGDVSINQRNTILRQFQDSPDPHVLLCHPKVMSHGLNMTTADTIVFYAPIYSNDEYQQVKDRINRPGQTRAMSIIRLGAMAIEWAIYQVLDGKGRMQSSILELYKQEVNLM